ncbi:MAG: RNA polymerase sigma factor RpoD/SigA [Spirochaetota bacterium]|nr:RNA polymerase sigma factor RpoD/SigA [Spirochaetota bacterium]
MNKVISKAKNMDHLKDYHVEYEIEEDYFLDHEDCEDEQNRSLIEAEEDTYDAIKSYLKEVSQYSLLSAEQEKELSQKIQAGDKDALNSLINSNLRLVIKIAKAFVSKDYPLIDIIQDGNIGLMRAAEKFDHTRNVRFSTYAAPWIKQMIIRALSQKRRTVRLPYRKEKLLKDIKALTATFLDTHHRHPDNKEIAANLGVTQKEIQSLKFSDVNTSSLDSYLNDENSFSLEDVIESNRFSPDEPVFTEDLVSQTHMALDSLTKKEKTIISLRFGLDSRDKKTLKEIGRQFGISAETVRQIETRTLQKLEENHQYLKSFMLQ